MKIIHVIKGKADPNTMNGVNRIVHDLANEQSRAGRDVEVWGLTATPGVVRHVHDYPLHLFRAFGFRLRAPEPLRKALAALPRGETIVHFHSVFVTEFHAISRELERLGIPWVQSPHGGHDPRGWRRNRLAKQIYFRLFERRLLRGAVAAHATGRSEVADINALAPRLPVVLIHNGLEPLPAPARAETAAEAGRPLFGYCGRLTIEQKGLDLMLEGYARYVRGGGHGDLWLIGEGNDRPRLERLSAALGIADRVTFTGSRFGEEKKTTLGKLDAFVHASRWEGFPMMLLEASMLGLPVVVSKETNFAEHVDEHRAGLVLERNDPELIAAAMHRIEVLHRERKLRQLGENGREMMLRQFGWDGVAKRLERELYCDPRIVDNPGSREDVLRKLFVVLAEEGIPYVAVGDTRALPGDIASDVDLVFDQDQIDRATRIIRGFARREGLAEAQVLRHEHTAYYVCLAWRYGNRTQVLTVDYCGDYLRAGRRLLSSKQLLHDRALSQHGNGAGQGFFVPETGAAFLYYLIKRLDKLSVGERTVDYLTEIWRTDEARCRAAFLTIWSASDMPDLIRLLEEDSGSAEAVRRLRARLHRQRPLRLADGVRELRRRILRLIQPTGLVVAVIGPDGAGKSAVIDALLKQTAQLFRRIQKRHLRPGILPVRGGGRSGPVLNPYARPPYGVLVSVTKLLYMAADYVAGYWIDLRIAIARSTLVVFDRYYHDLVADPRRWRYGGPVSVLRAMPKLLPRPGLVLLLDAPPGVILGRKQEVTADDCRRQVESYRAIAAAAGGAVASIDAARPFDEVVSDACSLLIEHMARRVRRRHV